jgi:hypothetical protein
VEYSWINTLLPSLPYNTLLGRLVLLFLFQRIAMGKASTA